LISVYNAESFGVPDIDVWGINSYRGTIDTGFDTLFSDYISHSNRPLIIAEFGPPASTHNSSGDAVQMPNNAAAQAQYIEVHWNDIVANRNSCTGGFVFEWTDEWWKIEDPTVQNTGTTVNTAYPGGWGDEEWFGVNSIALANPTDDPAVFVGRAPDIVTPRASVASLANLFSQTIAIPAQAGTTPITVSIPPPVVPVPYNPDILVPTNEDPSATTPVSSTPASPKPSTPSTPSSSSTPSTTPSPALSPVSTITPTSSAISTFHPMISAVCMAAPLFLIAIV